jgi:hypothetical protein
MIAAFRELVSRAFWVASKDNREAIATSEFAHRFAIDLYRANARGIIFARQSHEYLLSSESV